jgi:hypothetical protein
LQISQKEIVKNIEKAKGQWGCSFAFLRVIDVIKYHNLLSLW